MNAADEQARSEGAEPQQGRFASPHNMDVPLARAGEFQPLQLGSLKVWPPVVLAPMAGVTNLAFRSLCRGFGAGLYVSEMITARAFLHGNALTQLLAAGHPDEKPRSVQIYSSDPTDVADMVRILVDEGVDHVDMNFGCPVPKVTRQGGGSAIPVKPRLMASLVRAAVGAAGSVPVTVKVRKGIDSELLTFLDAGCVAQEEGAAAIGLHGRTAAELYAGHADWAAIGELVAAVTIPVLGNGDIWESFDALRMMRETGCAGVIVGRGCLGRPWLFSELASAFNGVEPQHPPNLGQIARIMEDHARRLVDLFGETSGMHQMRKWCTWYTKGFRNSAAMRAALIRLNSLEEMRSLLARMDQEEAFPLRALSAKRAKHSRTQKKVTLPEGYLDNRMDDRPPMPPRDPAQRAAWERALEGG